MNLAYLICEWLLGLLAVANFLYLWFRSSLMGLTFQLLQFAGWHHKTPGFWDLPGIETGTPTSMFTAKNWEDWLIFSAVSGRLPHWLVKLLTCPGCLSVHTSLWLSAAGCLLGLLHPLFLIVGIATWPALAVKLHKTI
jgi:hypothetical protein